MLEPLLKLFVVFIEMVIQVFSFLIRIVVEFVFECIMEMMFSVGDYFSSKKNK